MTKKTYLAISIVTILLATFVSAPGALADSPAFSHRDADDIGVFNIGLALGGVIRSFDKALKKEVLEFDYSLPKGSIIGVWTNNYPSAMTRDAIDAVKVGVKVPDPEQLREVSVKLEIKGEKAMQKIPLHLEAGWNYFQEPISWNTIGDLREVVFVVSPVSASPRGANPMWFDAAESGAADSGKFLEGLLYFDIGFYKLSFIEKNFIFLRIGLVLIISSFAALMAAFLRRFRVKP